MLLGVLPRLSGCDATIFPSFGGRFGFSEKECADILDGARRPMGSMPPILPCPGGGMTMEKIKTMSVAYGEDVCFLIGGSLIGHSPDLVNNAKHFMKIAGREDLYGPLESGHGGYRSYPSAHVPHADPSELAKLKQQMVTMEANLTQVTDMYLASEKSRVEEKKHAKAVYESSLLNKDKEGGHHKPDHHEPHRPGPGDTLAKGVAAPPTPVDGNYSKVFNRPSPDDWTWDRIPLEMYKQDGGSFKGCSRYELLGKRGERYVFYFAFS